MTGYQLFLRGSMVLTPLALAFAFGLEQIWLGMLASFGVGAWGWFGDKKSQNFRAPDRYLAGTIIMLTLSAFLGLAPYLLVAALLGALVSWDLSRFQSRIEHAPLSEGIVEIEKHHLTLLGFAVLGGGIFAGILLTARLQINFGAALFLAVILIISLSEIIRLFRS